MDFHLPFFPYFHHSVGGGLHFMGGNMKAKRDKLLVANDTKAASNSGST
jgi:hypothetical protein